MTDRIAIAAARHQMKYGKDQPRDEDGRWASDGDSDLKRKHETYQSLAKSGIGGRKPMSFEEYVSKAKAKDVETDSINRDVASGIKDTKHDSHVGSLLKSAKVKAVAGSGDVPQSKGDESGSIRLSLKLSDGSTVAGRLHFSARKDENATDFSFDPDEESWSPELKKRFANKDWHAKSTAKVISAKIASLVDSSEITIHADVKSAIEKTRRRNRRADRDADK